MKDCDLCTESGSVVYIEFDVQQFEEYKKLKNINEEFLRSMYMFRVNVIVWYNIRLIHINKNYSTEISYTLFMGTEYLLLFKRD
jgi:hypothetical protein